MRQTRFIHTSLILLAILAVSGCNKLTEASELTTQGQERSCVGLIASFAAQQGMAADAVAALRLFANEMGVPVGSLVRQAAKTTGGNFEECATKLGLPLQL